MSCPVKWTQGSLSSGSKGGGGECIHRRIKDNKEERLKDRRTNYDRRGVKIAHKDFYKIFEEGCSSCSSRSQETP